MEKGLFQKELAKRIGVDEMTIVNWEKSRTTPSRRLVRRVEEFFPVSLKEPVKGGVQA